MNFSHPQRTGNNMFAERVIRYIHGCAWFVGVINNPDCWEVRVDFFVFFDVHRG